MKKTNNLKVLPLIVISLLSAACQQTDENQNRPSENVPLRLTSGICTMQTRAFDSSWDNTDEIGVFTVKAGSTAAADITYSGINSDENVKYKITSDAFSGTETSVDTYNKSEDTYSFMSFKATGNDIYLPANGSDVDVYAYYPWTLNVSASNALSITIPSQQYASGNNENQKAVDVMKASAKSNNEANKHINIDNTTAQLTFSHIMSKVLVRVVVGEGYGPNDLDGSNISSVVLSGQPTAATFAPVTQQLTITPANSSITMAELADGDPDYKSKATVALKEGANETEEDVIHNYRAIILPNTEGASSANPKTTGSERQIKFNVGSVTYTYNITQEFKQGYKTEYTIILAANEMTVQASITPWTANVITTEKPLTPDP